ncbi:hypothetical protein MTO96_035276 [Rhipicephalus appendiculatus]
MHGGKLDALCRVRACRREKKGRTREQHDATSACQRHPRQRCRLPCRRVLRDSSCWKLDAPTAAREAVFHLLSTPMALIAADTAVLPPLQAGDLMAAHDAATPLPPPCLPTPEL